MVVARSPPFVFFRVGAIAWHTRCGAGPDCGTPGIVRRAARGSNAVKQAAVRVLWRKRPGGVSFFPSVDSKLAVRPGQSGANPEK